MLNLSDNNLLDIFPLSNLLSLTTLDLRGNNNIQCNELDALETQLLLDVFHRPDNCIYLTPPVVTILSPVEVDTYFSTGNINFIANAYDTEDGNLEFLVQWSSDKDGALGVGDNLNLSLSAETHIITALVTDSHGNTSSTSVNLIVIANTAPQLIIDSALNGAIFYEGESVSLVADAIDIEDGNISQNIQWTSNLDGLLGTGAVLNKTLSLGTHTLTASITDTDGGVHSVTTELVIEQIDLAVSVSGNGKRRTAILTWSDSRVQVDIYKNGVFKDTAASSGTVKYRFKNQAAFKVCESGTNYCSNEVFVQ